MKRLILLFPLSAVVAALGLTGCSEPDRDAHAGHAHAAEPKPGPASVDASAKCAAHGAPRAQCFICDPALRAPERLWCGGHARYEDRCWECHPELRDSDRLYCDEHGLYEDECFICHPEVASTSSTHAAAAGAEAGAGAAPALMCGEHGVPEAECGICHPELVAGLQPGQSVKIRLPASESARLAGVKTQRPTVGAMTDGLTCYAELAFNQNQLARIAAPVAGIVNEVVADLGNRVEEGQVVARIWSASIAEAVARAVLTHQTLDRERRLREERVNSEQDLQQAEAEHRAACQQLRTLGFTEAKVDELGSAPQDSVFLDVSAPFAGEIIERTAVRGQLIEVGQPLFLLADRSTMWAMLSIPESALGQIQLGQAVDLQVDTLPGRAFAGTLTWVGAEVDGRSRMARARAEIPNPDGLLKGNMFARARIRTREAPSAVQVPAAAVQQVGGRPVVFVRLADDLFAARPVRLGARANGHWEVLDGLQPEEEVAVTASFAIKSQLLASRLGAGCAHE